MADLLTHLRQRSGDDWLVGYDSQEFFALVERLLGELRSRPSSKLPLTILLAERDPLKFLAHFIAACAANCRIFLANPDWADAEWQQVFELVQPDLVWGAVAKLQATSHKSQEAIGKDKKQRLTSTQALELPTPHSPLPTPHILIPTGGTSGKIRFVIHTWETLMASVQGFREYFGVEQINSFCVLPLYHVSGLMQFLRSFTTGGQLAILPFRAVERGDRSLSNPEAFFLSLVPTQLQRLLDQSALQKAEGRLPRQRSVEGGQKAENTTQNSKLKTQNSIAWLARFHTVLLGGAPAWPDLLDRARNHRIRLAPTYGMTETASQIATLKPDDFLNGYTNSGQVLPHAQITIRSPSGESLNSPQIGVITVQAASLAKGYYPSSLSDQTFNPYTFEADSSEKHRSELVTEANSLAPQISCSGGLGELGPQKAGGWGEVPRTQPLNEAKMLINQRLEMRESTFRPDDLGYFDTDGYLHIVGRQSDKIITGGENVFPAEVEAAIRSTTLVQDICVIGVSDRQWGQAIIAVYVPINAATPTVTIQAALNDKLSKFKCPKHWITVDQLPRNAQGKVNRPHVEAIAKAWLSTAATID